MKQATIAAGILLLVIATTGCRTTEENYRSSYEAAIVKAKEKQAEGVDSITYNKILEQQRPKMRVVEGDSARMVTDYAWQSYGKEYPLKKYNVVVGAMRQKFNAEAFCDRLRTLGCQSYVITNYKHDYFVIAAGFNNLKMAADYIRDIHKHLSIKLPIDEPYIFDTNRIYIKNEKKN